MPITPKEIVEEINREFNSTELEVIADLQSYIDYELLSRYTIGNDLWIGNISTYLKLVHRNRQIKIIQHIFDEYEKYHWKIKQHNEDHLIFRAEK